MIAPQEGFQTKALSTPADIAILGGGAGMGKSFVLLLESIRNYSVKGFTGIIFRRTSPQITNPGALFDQSRNLYNLLDGIPNKNDLKWSFPTGSSIKFSHLQYDDTVYDHQGAEYALIGFDELCHFSETQFWYLISRNRSTCGVKPYVRATCNPDADSWVAKLVEWYIDQETGFPIKERDGILRYFTRIGGEMVWGNTKKEVIEQVKNIESYAEERIKAIEQGLNEEDLIKSFTFIGGSVYENKILLKHNPDYLGTLLGLAETEKQQLLLGNWKASQDGMALYDYQAIRNISSNYVTHSSFRCITADIARFGRDYTVIMVWQGWTIVKIIIIMKNDDLMAKHYIEEERRVFNIPVNYTLIDQDGVGGSVVKLGGYRGFLGGAGAVMETGAKVKENYANLKTQCAYRLAYENVNVNEIACQISDSMVKIVYDTGIVKYSRKIVQGQKVMDVMDLIMDDLRSFKKKPRDKDDKIRMSNKDEQKAILKRSPDFGDNLVMRKWFDVMRVDKSVRHS